MKHLYFSSIILTKNQLTPTSLANFKPVIAAYKRQGFGLIELIVAFGIIGILAAIAIPAYSAYTIRAKVTYGLAILSSSARTMELNYTTSSVYQCSQNSWSARNFNFECNSSANGYTITAYGLDQIANYSYSINATGEHKTLSHPAGASNSCWRISNAC